MLLSFAHFEREVTAERIRDKVAASKKRGMWMGGAVPMGYDARDKALVVNETEAASVRTIFREYLALGSVPALRRRLAALGIVSKRRKDRHGRVTGGTPFSTGALYRLHRNPVYGGKVKHGDVLHDGLHAGPLEGIVQDAIANQMADRAWVVDALADVGVSPDDLTGALARAEEVHAEDTFRSEDTRARPLASLVHRIKFGGGVLEITCDLGFLLHTATPGSILALAFEEPVSLRRDGRNRPIILHAETGTPRRDAELIALVADARRWMDDVVQGRARTVAEIVERGGHRPGTVSRILPLAWLAPDIAAAISGGRQPAGLTAKRLRELPDLPLDWVEQRLDHGSCLT